MPVASRRIVRLRFSLLTMALNLAIAAPVLASDTDRHLDKTKLDAIVVTSTPLRGTAEQMSEPVSVLAGEELDDRRSATLGETVSALPGVQSSNFGAGVGRPIIRGLDGARVAVLSGGLSTQDVSTVSQDHAPAIEAFLADQIEVLKGPATLLYGQGAIGGVVNVVDGRIAEVAPEQSLSGRAELRFDDVNDGHTGMLRLDGGNERFALHFDAVQRRNDDYDLPDGGQQANSFLETDTVGLGASVLGDWGFLGLAISRYQDKYGNPGEPGDVEAGEAGVSLDIDQDRVELKGGLAEPFSGVSYLRYSVANTDYQHIEFEGDEIGTQFVKDASEARIELTHAEIGGWLGAVGVQLNRSEFEAIGEEAFVPRTKSRSSGLFVVEQYQWDQLQFDLGARVDRVSSDPDGGPERSFSPYSVSAGAIWSLSETWEVVANLDHAQRAPAEEELFADGPHVATAAYEIGDPNLTEEAAKQLEIGLHFHSSRFDAKVSAYHNRFDDFIYLVDTGLIDGEGDEALPIRQWTQNDARFRGFEAEGTWQLADNDSGNWSLRLFGDTVRATLKNGGNVPRIVPARLGSELRWFRNGWRANLAVVRSAEQDDVAVNETSTDGYTMVNFGGAYHWDVGNIGWEAFVDARNLTDQQARVHTSFLKDVVELPGRGVSMGLRVLF